MPIFTRHDVKKMMIDAVDRIKAIADSYANGREIDPSEICKAELGYKTGIKIIEGKWPKGDFPRRNITENHLTNNQ